jgi:hypothetical protein
MRPAAACFLYVWRREYVSARAKVRTDPAGAPAQIRAFPPPAALLRAAAPAS